MPNPQKTNASIASASRLAARYRFGRAQALTPAARLEQFEQLQADALATLMSNPEAHAAFIRRNHHRRRQAAAARLEAEMKRPRLGRTDG